MGKDKKFILLVLQQFDNGIFQLTNQNSDQSKFKLTLTNQKLNSLSMWRVYSLHHTSVFTYSHANTPLGQSERAYYLSYFINIYIYMRNCACSLEYSSLSTLAGLSYHICGKLEMVFKGSPSSQHQHCTDEAQKAETVLSAVRYTA